MSHEVFRVAFAVDSRAEYGIVRRYLSLLNGSDKVSLSLLATGAFLEKEFDLPVTMAEEDGFAVAFEAPLPCDYSDAHAVVARMAVCIEEFNDHFDSTKYDLLVVLGDRYEMLAVALAAAMHRIPILHIHGGESTFGNYDEFIRHSITKLSAYHFASCEDYRNRIIQLGEIPERVFNMGALGSENCQSINFSAVTEEVRNLVDGDPFYVIVFHPETMSSLSAEEQIARLLEACSRQHGCNLVFIGSNADAGAFGIKEQIRAFVAIHQNAYYFENLSPDNFLYLVSKAIALVGNSSSGIIEAPSLGVATVNIGNRQKGRVRASSVVDVPNSTDQIAAAMCKVRMGYKGEVANPYFKPHTAQRYYEKTLEILKELDHRSADPKVFYDIPLRCDR